MKKKFFLKIACFLWALMLLSGASQGAVPARCDTTDPAVLIQQVKSLENSVSAARLLKEMDLIIKELHAIINVETAPEIENTSQQGNVTSNRTNNGQGKQKKKRNRDIELEMTIIPLDDLQEWAKPLLTKELKDKMESYKVVDKDGKIRYDDDDIVEKARSFTQEVLMPTLVTDDSSLEEASDIKKQQEMLRYIQNAYISSSADAYAVSLLAQYRLADFDEVILTPFREDLEESEDLMDRFRKNTWAILGLMSQINMSNIRSASNLSLLASKAMANMEISDRVKSYLARKVREEANR